MSIGRRQLFIILLPLVVIYFSTARAQQLLTCEPTKVAAICFPSEPISLHHSTKTLTIHFTLQDSNTRQFRFNYQIIKDGTAITPVITSGDDYSFTGADIAGRARSVLKQRFQGDGSYTVRVTVQFKDQPKEDITQESTPQTITDHPKVAAVIVGISKYDKGGTASSASQIVNLTYADNDADAFKVFLSEAFPTTTYAVTSSELTSKDQPGKKAILAALASAANIPDFYGDDDWFVFYFSGHGVVENNNNTVLHYISTWDLNASNIQGTAIWLEELVPLLAKIPAPNKLVVLDSCFSGINFAPLNAIGSSAADPTTDSTAKSSKALSRTYKIAYVKDGIFVSASDAGNPTDQAADSKIARESFTGLSKRAVYLSAASVDHVAEEGLLTWDTQGRLVAHDADAASGGDGHGFLTFVLLSELQSQIPSRFEYKEVVSSTGKSHIDSPSCRLDFTAAGTSAAADLRYLGLTGRDTQVPEEVQTQTPPPAVPCEYLPLRKPQ